MFTSLLLLAIQAAAPPPVPTPTPDKIVCKMETQANSRIPSRVCLPQSEWARIAKDNADDWGGSRNQHAGGRSGTIVTDPEGYMNGLGPPGTTVPGISTRPPR